MGLKPPPGGWGSPALERAAVAAQACGVTRLAELTGLDRIGAPVFQAVRPWSRGLSVHAGKALEPERARLGALMEAVECAFAEAFAPTPPDALDAAFAELPQDERAPRLCDFAERRDRPPDADEPRAWARARRLLCGRGLWVPVDAVSLDYSREGDRRLERSSNGLAARFSAEAAARAALLELIERDALAGWGALPDLQRAAAELDLDSIPFAWFAGLLERLRAAGLIVCVHRLQTLVGVPALLCQLLEPGEARVSARVFGTAADPSAETALMRAVMEAAQSRLTAIAGARDDVFFPAAHAGGFGLALPLPPGVRALAFEEIDEPLPADADVFALAGALADAGYPDTAIVDLAAPEPGLEGVFVAKAFCPGLASGWRTRRAPC